MTRKLTMRAAIGVVVASVGATWCLFAMTPAGSITKSTKQRRVTEAPATTPVADIASAGPLTHVWLGNDLSCQVQHIDDADYEFFPARHISRRCRDLHRHGRSPLRARFY